jgi:hypothetical protein
MEDMEDMEHQDEDKNHMLTTMENNNNAISWACEHEHEWVNMSRWTRKNLLKNILMMWTTYFWIILSHMIEYKFAWYNILPCGHGWK